MFSDLELMQIQADVLFTHDDKGRMKCVNELMGGVAPRFFLGRTQSGNITRYHYHLSNEMVEEIDQVISKKPDHVNLARIIGILNSYQPIDHVWIGPAFVFPDQLNDSTRAIRITDANKDHLRSCFPHVIDQLNWREPCYAIVDKGVAVSICCTARSTTVASEASLETEEAFRGMGYGTEVAIAWAHAIRKLGRIPLYSTGWDNFPSLAVAKKLKLRYYGTDVHFS